MAAPISVPITFSDDEQIIFRTEWKQHTGAVYPVDDVTVDFVVFSEGGSTLFTLTEAAGQITKDADTGTLTFDAGELRFSPGNYRHGCRATNLSDGRSVQVWGGPFSIYQGGF